MSSSSRGVAALLVVLAAVCFGTTGTAQALGAQGVDPVALGAARIVVGGTLLAAVLGLQRLRMRPPARRAPSSGRARTALIALVGAAGVAAYQPAFFTGTRENGIAVGTVVALGCAPVATGVLEWLLLRRVPSRRWFASTALAIAGVAILAGAFSSGVADGTSALGLLGSLGAAGAYALYAVCAKLLLERGLTPAGAMGAQFGVAAVLLLPVLLAAGIEGPLAALPAVLWLGVVTVAVAYTLFARGLRRLPAAQVATLTLVEPATATLLGVLLVGERLTPEAVIGVAVVLAAVLLLAVPRRRREGAALRPGAGAGLSPPVPPRGPGSRC